MASLATRLEKTKREIGQHFAQDLQVVQYGRAHHRNGGDYFQAHDLVPHIADGRDKTFVRVSDNFSFANARLMVKLPVSATC